MRKYNTHKLHDNSNWELKMRLTQIKQTKLKERIPKSESSNIQENPLLEGGY